MVADESESGWTETGRGGSTRETRGTGITKWSLTALGLLILLVVVFAQNTESVPLEVLWTDFSAPLFVIVLLAGLGFTLLWEILTFVLRHRRRRRARQAD